MKTIALGQVIDEATNLETVAMTIDENSVSVLMRNLTNLYSNPVKAVFREYVSNALDSHVKAGVSTPIEVTLPKGSDFEPTFVVRDFGVGMSKQEIIDIYSRYGSSTKRDSNTQIGAFGLGAKSALAITDRFDVVTIKDGVRVEFFVKKNGQGVGVVHFVDEAPTNEANGVEVRIPMTARKAADFADVAKDFFTTWKPNTVKVDGVLNSETIYDTASFLPITSAGEVFAWVGKKEEAYRYASGLDLIKFVIGGIVYDLERKGNLPAELASKIGYASEVAKAFGNLTQSNRTSIYINLPIGSVELTPSREELMFTDRTVNTIVNVVSDFNEQVPTHFADYLNTLDRVSAVTFYGKNTSYFGGSLVKWQGETLVENVELDNGWKVYSREGSSMGDPSVNTRINIVEALAPRSSYARSHYVVVKTDDVSEANAVVLRKNLRDYSASVYGDKNITAFLVKSSFNNVWLDLLTSVTLDDVLSTAKAYRSAKKSEAQTGTSRTKATYVVWKGEKSLDKVTSDTISGTVLYAREDQSVLNSLYSSVAREVYRGYKGGLRDDVFNRLNSVFAGNTIIFLPANRSLDNLKKQYPTAVDVNDFYNEKVNAVLAGSDMNSEVLATLIRSTRNGGSVLAVLGMLDTASVNALANPVLRAVAQELKTEGSVLVALNYYKNHYEKVEISKGFALDELFPLFTLLSTHRSISVEQMKQFVSFANIVVGK